MSGTTHLQATQGGPLDGIGTGKVGAGFVGTEFVGGIGSVGTGKVGVNVWVAVDGAFVGEVVLVGNAVMVGSRVPVGGTVGDKVGVIIGGSVDGDLSRSSTGKYSSPKMRLGGISTG